MDKAVYCSCRCANVDGATSFGVFRQLTLPHLRAWYAAYRKDGFVIVGVPANNFGAQEPGTNEDIKTFCTRNYNVTFPMMSKVSVKGSDKTPLYQYLTSTGGGEIRWNFTKFLVGKDGNVIARFETKVTPEDADFVKAVEKALAQ